MLLLRLALVKVALLKWLKCTMFNILVSDSKFSQKVVGHLKAKGTIYTWNNEERKWCGMNFSKS